MCLTSFKHLKKIFIFATKADPSPPLGTILGNIGVNTSAFCKEFNDFTKNLPDYFLLKVYIYVFDNRTFKFFVKFPSTGSIINLIKVEKKILVDKSEKVV